MADEGKPGASSGSGKREPRVPPKRLPGFPNASRARPKTQRPAGGLRTRWKDQKSGHIYEWDEMHGTVEAYNGQGRHLGEFDPDTGQQTGVPIPTRRVEP